MKARLTDKDIKSLKYEQRTGTVFALFLFFLGLLVSLVYFIANDNNTAVYIIIAAVVSAAAVYFLINRKVLTDIGNKIKILEIKTLEKKTSRTDWEVGSGSVASYLEMQPFDLYNFIIEGIFYKVDKELYETCSAGDKIIFHIAPKSEHILYIEKFQ